MQAAWITHLSLPSFSVLSAVIIFATGSSAASEDGCKVALLKSNNTPQSRYKSVESILKNSLDQVPPSSAFQGVGFESGERDGS